MNIDHIVGSLMLTAGVYLFFVVITAVSREDPQENVWLGGLAGMIGTGVIVGLIVGGMIYLDAC